MSAPKSDRLQDRWPATKSTGDSSSSPHLNARSSAPTSETDKSINNNSQQIFTGWLQQKYHKHSSSSSGETEDAAAAVRGRFFPAKLSQALGMAKCLVGLLLVAFGALALWERAAMSNLGSGKINNSTAYSSPS